MSFANDILQNTNQDATSIPVIDILNANAQTAETLIEAVVKWGFVYIKAHGSGFTPDVIENMFQLVSKRRSAYRIGMADISLH